MRLMSICPAIWSDMGWWPGPRIFWNNPGPLSRTQNTTTYICLDLQAAHRPWLSMQTTMMAVRLSPQSSAVQRDLQHRACRLNRIHCPRFAWSITGTLSRKPHQQSEPSAGTWWPRGNWQDLKNWMLFWHMQPEPWPDLEIAAAALSRMLSVSAPCRWAGCCIGSSWLAAACLPRERERESHAKPGKKEAHWFSAAICQHQHLERIDLER